MQAGTAETPVAIRSHIYIAWERSDLVDAMSSACSVAINVLFVFRGPLALRCNLTKPLPFPGPLPRFSISLLSEGIDL